MKTMIRIFPAAMLIFAAASLNSCSTDNNNLIGTWESSLPQNVFPTISGTEYAMETTVFEFDKGASPNAISGPVTLSTTYDMTLLPDSTAVSRSCIVKATISGTWIRDEKEDDDYVLSFNKNSLSVNAENAIELGPVTEAFLLSITRFSTISDVEITKDGSILSFEDSHDNDYTCTRKR